MPAGIYGMWQRRLLANVRERDGAGGRARGARAATSSRSSASSTGCTRRMAASARTRPRAATPCVVSSLDEAVAELDQALRPGHGEVAVGPGALPPRAHPSPAGAAPSTTPTRAEAERRPAAARRRRLHGERHRRRRQPDLGRLVQDHRRHGELGQLDRPQQPRPVRQSRQPEYRNLFEMWAKGRYFPVAYSRDRRWSRSPKASRGSRRRRRSTQGR